MNPGVVPPWPIVPGYALALMRFTFLGTGTSAGIPAIGCNCDVCRSKDTRDQRLRCAASIRFTDSEAASRTVLLDAGPDIRAQSLREGLDRLDAIFFTHNHVDHTFGLDEVRRFNVLMGRPIDIYAEQHTLDFLHRVYQHIFDRNKNINDSFVATLIANRIEPETNIDLHGMRFRPFRLLHGRLPVLGYRVEPAPGSKIGRAVADEDRWWPLAYCTDVSAVPPESWGELTGLRTLVLDALRHRHHPTHLTLDQAITIADRIGAEQTYFVHMSHDLAHAETDANLPESMSLAYDGLTLGSPEPDPEPDPAQPGPWGRRPGP